MVWKDGQKYEGYWLANEHSGKGRMMMPNGDFYEGEWMNDMMHGKGIY